MMPPWYIERYGTGLGMVRGAHHAVEVALHDAHAARVVGTRRARRSTAVARHQRPPPNAQRAALEPHASTTASSHERDAELEVAGQRERRDDRDQHRAERAAERDHQVEARQVARDRASRRASSPWQNMQATNRPDAVKRRRDRAGRSDGTYHAIAGSSTTSAATKSGRTYQRGWSKREDEGEQVERERQHPQERHARDVLRDVVGDREQQHRAHGARAPATAAARRARAAPAHCAPRRRCRRAVARDSQRDARAQQRRSAAIQRTTSPSRAACRSNAGSNRNGKPSSASSDAKFDSANSR